METVLNMLALIDNPMQDIPLAGVLKSPIGGMKDRELAIVMAEFKKDPDRGEDVGFYGAVKRYLEKHGESEEDAVIYRKLAAFQNLLTTLREESMYLPVSRLIYRIFDLTGYDKYAAAMPAGKTRQANLAMLVQKAEDYEKTSYQGLFDFIRYIEKLKKYNTDFGEASRSGEHDDAVRITRFKPLTRCNVKTMPHPGFPTDMQPQMAVLLSVAEGTSILTEGVWDNRFQYVGELSRMGANIQVDGKVAVIEGVPALTGVTVKATDLRAGAAMIIAGMVARGETRVTNIQYVDRGYEDVVEKFSALGADIRRVPCDDGDDGAATANAG